MENIRKQIGLYLEQSLFGYDLAGLLCGIRIGQSSPLPYAGLDAEFAHGYLDFEKQTPLAVGDATHFASVSKLFVSAAVLRLVRAERINLDTKLIDCLPDFSMADARHRDISLRHILTHTSGIPDIEDYCWQNPDTNADALLRYAHSDEVRSLRLLWNPSCGSFRYSNIAFDLLGAAIENLTGKSFERVMAEFFFEPLGMANSTFLTPLRECGGPRLARPHYKDEKKHIRVQDYFPYNGAHLPSSTLSSTLRDIKKWGDAWIEAALGGGEAISSMDAKGGGEGCGNEGESGRLGIGERRGNEGESGRLGIAGAAEALAPHADVPGGNEKIGLAWFIRKQNGYTFYGHEGADDGFRSSFWICPELQLQITVLANLDKAPAKKIGKHIADMVTTDRTTSCTS